MIHDEITWVPEEDEEEYLFLMFILHPNPPIPGERLMVFFLLYQLQFPLGFSICFALCVGPGKKNSGQKGIRPRVHLQNADPSAGSPAACRSSVI